MAAAVSAVPGAYQGLGKRFVALAVDSVVLGVLGYVIAAFTGGTTSDGFSLKRMPLLLTAALVLMLGSSACSAVADLGPMTSTGQSFMSALKAGDQATSYGLLQSQFQKQVGDAKGWASYVAKVQPTDWNFNYSRVNGSQGTIQGTATALGGKQCTMTLSLVKVGNDWKVAGFNFTPK